MPNEKPVALGCVKNAGQLVHETHVEKMVYGVDYYLACGPADYSGDLQPINAETHDLLLAHRIMREYPYSCKPPIPIQL